MKLLSLSLKLCPPCQFEFCLLIFPMRNKSHSCTCRSLYNVPVEKILTVYWEHLSCSKKIIYDGSIYIYILYIYSLFFNSLSSDVALMRLLLMLANRLPKNHLRWTLSITIATFRFMAFDDTKIESLSSTNSINIVVLQLLLVSGIFS